MKGICSIILLISTIVSFAEEDNPKAMIWYKGDTFYKSLHKKAGATLYFEKWSNSLDLFLGEENYHVAIQLKHDFDPKPDDEVALPSITTLAAIEDEALVFEYLAFLENHSRTLGLNYLVLPDTSGLSRYEQDVLSKAKKKSPFYFIAHSEVSQKLPSSKKEVELAPSAIWIADQTVDVKKLAKWSRKQSRTFYKTFGAGALSSSIRKFEPTKQLPTALFQRIFEAAVVCINGGGQLPIQAHGVVYFGENDQLRERISKYVKVYDKPQPEKFPVILDRRNGFDRKVFGNEIILSGNDDEIEQDFQGILIPEDCEYDEITLSKMLFGAKDITGRSMHAGNQKIENKGFLGYSSPSFEGLDEGYLKHIDEFIQEAISGFATPGSQLSVIKNGSVVLEKSFGYFTYDSLKEVANQDLFDLASITKVAATTPAIALLVDQQKIALDDSIGKHLSSFSQSNKSHVTIRQLLAHNGGTRSYIPFWRRAMTGDRLDAFYYRTKEDERRDVRSYGFEPHPALKDSLQNWIISSDLIKNPNKYNYSDLGFMILHLLVEEVSGLPFDEFMDENFYKPMQLGITFNPKNKGVTLKNIVPTEYDERYRNDQVWGEVHDRNAHVFGGVAGHAGLFSNASDLAKMMFMLSNGGYYNGRQYLQKETLEEFNQRYFEKNRRGLGWDKKDWKRDAASPLATDSSFGHTGFTGTMVWADPEKEVVFVFLSNRIYPDSNNSRLMELNTRTEIHNVIYESILTE